MSLNALLPLFIYVPMVCLTVAGVICPQFGSKDSAKNRFSEEKENKLSFLSVRFLFKSKTKQNKSPKTFIFLLFAHFRVVVEELFEEFLCLVGICCTLGYRDFGELGGVFHLHCLVVCLAVSVDSVYGGEHQLSSVIVHRGHCEP